MDKGKYTPAGSVPFVKNEDVVPTSGSFNYSSVVGIMLYLYGHTCPEISFAVDLCARYIYVLSKKSHEESLKQIGRHETDPGLWIDLESQ